MKANPRGPSWRTADTETTDPSVENPELKYLPFHSGVSSNIALHASLTPRDFFLAHFYLPGSNHLLFFLLLLLLLHFFFFFSKPAPSISSVIFS